MKWLFIGFSFCLFLCLCSCSRDTVGEQEDFSTLMGFHQGAWEFVHTDEDYDYFQYFKNLYEKHCPLLFASSGKVRIPKVMHFIWLGSRPFPQTSIKYLQSWIAYHPDWKVIYWTDRRRPLPHPKVEVRLVSDFPFVQLGSQFSQSNNYGEQSTILRYEILYQEGGLYIDHDVECFQPFDAFHRFDFYCGLNPPDCSGPTKAISVSHAIIGSRPRHPIMKKTLELVERYWDDLALSSLENHWESLMHRVVGRTTLRLEEAVRLLGFEEKFSNLILPAGYFSKMGGQFGLYADHKHETSWLHYESQFERSVRREVEKMQTKTSRICFFALVIAVCNLFALLMLFRSWRFLQKVMVEFKNR